MGQEWPGMECANSSCLTMTSLGLQAACPSHLTLPPQEVSHGGLAGGGQQLSGGGAVVEAQHLPQAGIVEGLQLCPLYSLC